MPETNPEKISDQEIDRLLERVSYLYREADMLSKVIEYVPYDENPPQKPSILEILGRIDLLQTEYILPLVKQAENSSELQEHPDLERYYEKLRQETIEEQNVQVILKQIVSHRKKVYDTLKRLDNREWAGSVKFDNTVRSIRDVIDAIIEFEMSLLSSISDQVMVYSQQRSNQREIERRQKHHDRSSD